MLRSEYIAGLVRDAVAEAKEANRRAVETASKVLEATKRGLEETMASFIAWAARHGVDVSDARDARMTLRFGEEVADVTRAVREGLRVWKEAGMPEERYCQAKIRYPGGGVGDAWRELSTG